MECFADHENDTSLLQTGRLNYPMGAALLGMRRGALWIFQRLVGIHIQPHIDRIAMISLYACASPHWALIIGVHTPEG